MAIGLIVYLIGVVLNLLLMIIEESGYREPIWKVVILWPKRKETWWAVADKALFVFGSFISYFIFGIIFYIMRWRT